MERSTLATAGFAIMLAGAVPALAQINPDPAATPVAAPISDKDQAALSKCKALTQTQIAQSSKCTKLMKDAGIKAPPKDPYANGYH